MTVRPFDPVRNAAEGVTPDNAGWQYLSFKTVHLAAGARLAAHTKAEETALIWLGGRATVEGFGTVGGRVDVWDGKPFAVLLPPGVPYDLRAVSPCDLAIVSAPAQSELPPRLIRPAAARLPRCLGGARLRLLLPQRHGRRRPGVALHHRPRPRLADGLEEGLSS